MPDESPRLLKLVEAFNESNEALRHGLLEECWSENGRLIQGEAVVASTREQLEAHIASERADPKFYLSLIDPVETSTDLEWTRWRLLKLREAPAVHSVEADRSADGRLKAVKTTVRDASEADADKEWHVRLLDAAISSPIPAAGLLGGLLYLALRIPVGLFYNDLGVTPDEVGFGPQVLVPQSLTLLVAFVLASLCLYVIGALAVHVMGVANAAGRLERLGHPRRARLVYWMLGIGAGAGVVGFLLLPSSFVFLGPFSMYIALIPATVCGYVVAALAAPLVPGVKSELQELRELSRRSGQNFRLLKAFLALAAVYGALGLLIGMPIWALVDAAGVRSGDAAGGRLTPWRALPVELRWGKDAAKAGLNNECRYLRLLGSGNGQVVLFDNRLDKVFRIPVGDATVSVTRRCPVRGRGSSR